MNQCNTIQQTSKQEGNHKPRSLSDQVPYIFSAPPLVCPCVAVKTKLQGHKMLSFVTDWKGAEEEEEEAGEGDPSIFACAY